MYDNDFTRLATRVDGVDANSASDINQLDDNNAQVQGNVVAVLQHNFISGLEISNDADTEHDINVAAGSAVDSTNVLPINLTSEMTKRIDAAWAVGDDSGGLDTGSVANTTWYYIYIIIKDSDSSVDVLISASKAAPTMPAGYTYFRRIRGAVLTDGSANITQFYQKDDSFWFKDRVADISDTSPGTSRNLGAVKVPPDMIGIIRGTVRNNAVASIAFGSPADTDAAPSSSTADLYVSASEVQDVIKTARVDSSSQIYYRSTDGSIANHFHLTVHGFIDSAQS